PINPNYPLERISYMLSNSGADILLTHKNNWNNSLKRNLELINLNDEIIFKQESGNLNKISISDDTAYLIYTSGSTGMPKGVSVPHRSLVNFLYAIQSKYNQRFSENDKCLSLTNICFDVSVFEIFMPLVFGSRLILFNMPKLIELKPLVSLIIKEKITFAYIPPTLLINVCQMLSEQNKQVHLNKLLVGVEPIKGEVLDAFLTLNPNIEILNGYGPTETTICSNIYKYQAGEYIGKNVPIGKPLNNNSVYILNEYSQPVPMGVPGELCISGAGLSKGYIAQPAAMTEKFIDHPFKAGELLYRTGDLARWLPDGNIEFIGRIDEQVKIRGYRIEPGEVEWHLSQLDTVQEVVVLARKDGSDQQYLCAYIVSDNEIRDIRKVLSKSLPSYMIPSFFIFLKKIPLTVNGKVDRKALPEPKHLNKMDNLVKPRTSLEKTLSKIWKDSLNIKQISIKDNFFDLGGHSLKAIQMVNNIYKVFKVEIPLQMIFENPTIEELANEIYSKDIPDGSIRNMTKLNLEGKMNIFCFPPMLGLGIVFKGLSKILEGDFTFYGLDFIEEESRIEQYVNLITNVHSNSPYIFIGYSAGGNLAFEVAKYMETKGYEVSDIIMLDSKHSDNQVNESDDEIEKRVEEALIAMEEQYTQFINDDSLRQHLNVSVLREKLGYKMKSYIYYINQLINDSKVNSNLHFIKEDNSDCKENLALTWENAITPKIVEYKGFGKHTEMLSVDNIKKNAQIIKDILEKKRIELQNEHLLIK
ncbi:amino acid adenylation domain-containing protein, partial [Bacillus subtilis]